MANKIKFKRGVAANLPTLDVGEPGFVTDRGGETLYIGSNSGNIQFARKDELVTAAERTSWNAKEDASNKTTTINKDSTDAQYPSAKAVIEFVTGFAGLPDIKPLSEMTWAEVSKISEAGKGDSYFEIGDCHQVELNGTVGTIVLNTTMYAYILGFDHNSEIEGRGITFGTFKTAATGGVDVCFIDSKYGTNAGNTGDKYFQMNHWGATSFPYNANYGGWSGCDARYDILGSTNKAPSGYGAALTVDRTGYDPEDYDIVNAPVTNTLIAAFPSELRAVMKPITKYTDNYGNSSNSAENVTKTKDYLPFLAEFEIFGTCSHANQYEQNNQRQYTYFAVGNSKEKKRHSATSSVATWLVRSPSCSNAYYFCFVNAYGIADDNQSRFSRGVSPIFMV